MPPAPPQRHTDAYRRTPEDAARRRAQEPPLTTWHTPTPHPNSSQKRHGENTRESHKPNDCNKNFDRTNGRNDPKRKPNARQTKTGGRRENRATRAKNPHAQKTTTRKNGRKKPHKQTPNNTTNTNQHQPDAKAHKPAQTNTTTHRNNHATRGKQTPPHTNPRAHKEHQRAHKQTKHPHQARGTRTQHGEQMTRERAGAHNPHPLTSGTRANYQTATKLTSQHPAHHAPGPNAAL